MVVAAAASGEASARSGTVPADPAPEMGMRELRTKDWFRQVQEKLSIRYQVEVAQLRFSAPPPRLAAFVRGPAPPASKKARTVRPRRHDIVVVDVEGQKRGQFRAVTARGSDEPPKDLRFLRDDRLIYEAIEPPPPPPRPTRGRNNNNNRKKVTMTVKVKPPARVAVAETPKRLFIIQPVARRARPIRCEGVHFTFGPRNDRLAFVAGTPERAFVSVDGAQVYPRRKKDRTVITGEPVWSKDGYGLAFLETPKARPGRLVLLANYESPREDVSWDLPPDADLEGARVILVSPGQAGGEQARRQTGVHRLLRPPEPQPGRDLHALTGGTGPYSVGSTITSPWAVSGTSSRFFLSSR